MQYEVELKFRLNNFEIVETSLMKMGAVEKASVSHIDRYFNHPARDFRTTDEAFRIRSVDQSNCVTYKGAVIGNVAKSRHEIEVGFDSGTDSVEKLVELFKMLGFRFVREVRKTRRLISLESVGRRFELALDEVPPLGRFLEIELLASIGEREDAEAAVWKLARSLGLTCAEPRSYLDLLLEE